ncbi:MAG TPA: bifunctional phosphopantothenoylcysteine decarboxylase/phosphopantothenate--cysteine ligase CoaBC [Thermoplasmata archaeon]|jgi:phosphopantothenoylcysteine decarboxylase/phosphopantothenate--cysteine ligase
MHPAERIRGRKSLKLQGKTIVLGVTGSIAAVESIKLAHDLIRHGADVHAVLSKSGQAIVHPNALQFATGHAVVTELTGEMDYLKMCGRDGIADLLLIAPCTSNTLSKIANGIDDTTVTTYAANALGSGIPIILAPAAHETMADSRPVVANLKRLLDLGVEVVEPKREEDKAKMADIDAIVARVIRRLGPKDLAGTKVLVVLGATTEPIDDVRLVTNRSSGATGVELAKAAFEHGADVEMWLGRHEVPAPPWIPGKRFATTADLAALAETADADITLVPAAVADFSPKKAKGKIPTREGAVTLELQPTPKVLSTLRKGTRKALVGFKAEAGVSNAELKSKSIALLKEAKLDLVVANDVLKMKGDATSITIFDRKGRSEAFEGSKGLAAERIWRAVLHGVSG